MWYGILEILATQKYFIWVLTMPGYGLSQHPKTQQSHLTDFIMIRHITTCGGYVLVISENKSCVDGC